MNDNHDGIDQEDHLSDHTISMRQAVRSCQQLHSNPVVTFHPDSTQRARAASVSSERKEACAEFWKEPHIPTVEASSISSHDFRRRYHNRNLPCIISGLDQTCFKKVTTEWRNSDGTIHRDWFRNVLGEDTMVPLRRQQESTELDEDGRSMECETRKVTMNEWIDLLTKESDIERSSLYLKDWHLVSLLRERDSNHLPLYQCPQHFEHDLLNSLLTKCTKGDYRFCYWGPAKSTTTRHSDVLHSFSWSYNVAGTKEWTFYSPFDAQTCIVTQHAGECVFVPCQWQHQVVNLEETLSINHNWITTANVDQTWDCLVTEMETIRNELSSWGISSWESSESMLRGKHDPSLLIASLSL